MSRQDEIIEITNNLTNTLSILPILEPQKNMEYCENCNQKTEHAKEWNGRWFCTKCKNINWDISDY